MEKRKKEMNNVILLFIFVLCLLMTYANIKLNYKSLREEFVGPATLQLKITCYQNILIPIFFVLAFLILNYT